MADKNLLEQLENALQQAGTDTGQLTKLMQDLQNASDEVVKTILEQQKAIQKNNELINNTINLAEEELSANKRIAAEQVSLFEKRKQHEEEIQKLKSDSLALEAEMRALEEKAKSNGNVLSDAEKERLEALRLGIEAKQRQIDLERSEIKEGEYRNNQLKEENSIHNNIISKLEYQLTSMVSMNKVWNSFNNGASFSSALFSQFADNATQLLKTVNSSNAEFAKTTGQIADRTLMFGYGLSQFGIGFEELNKASADLFVSMSNFSNLNKNTQLELAESAAKMELLGVNSQTTGKILNDLTKGMRMNAEQASQTNEYLARVAIGIGVAPSKMAADFSAALPKMQAFGKQGVEVFADLAKQAKSLGMEMNSLMGIVGDTFDTFEGGARAAGKLNAILGGDYLNSVEMLNATESERVEILKRSFDMSGKNFDSLDKYEKKALAATLGITDLNEASKLFGSSTADLTADMEKQAAAQEKLEAVQREAVEVQKKMNEIFNALLIIIRPLVSIIESLVNAFTMVNDALGKVHPALSGLPSILLAVGTGFFFFGGKAVDAAKSVMGFGSGIVDGIGKLKQFRETMAGFGGGVQGFKSAFTTLFGSGMGPQGPANVPTPNIPPVNPASAFSFSAFMKGIATGFAEFANPRTAIGAGVFVLVAASVAGSLYLLSLALKQFTGIDFEQVMKGLGVLSLVTLAIIGLGVPAVAAMAALGAVVILGLSVAFYALGSSLVKLGEGLARLSQFNLSLAALGNSASGATVMVDAITEIGAALEKIPEGKTITLNALNQTLTTARSITEEEIKPSKDFVNAVREYYVAQGTSKEASQDAIVAALKEIKSTISAATQQNQQSVPVKIVLANGQELTGNMFGMKAANFLGTNTKTG